MRKIKDYFKIEELVSKQVLLKYGEKRCWFFFDPRILELLLWVRVEINNPITINNWSFGGFFSQRGLRENTCSIVMSKNINNQIYLSAHVLGMAFDFDVKGMSAEQVRKWLKDNKENAPHSFRLEEKVNWVHIDVMTDKFDTFNP